MASGRGKLLEMSQDTSSTMSHRKQNHQTSEPKNGRTNGFKNGLNGKTNGKSDKGTSCQNDFFESFEETPLFIAILTYLGYAILVLVGHIRDFLRFYGLEKDKSCTEPKLEGFVPLLISWESFYTRNLYRRVRDCWNRAISSTAGAEFDVMERVSHDHYWTFEYVLRAFVTSKSLLSVFLWVLLR